MAANVLGEYLRARRERMNPADVGLSATGVRRTPGLRREEVATLAGISADYYLRLEQGRDRNPSTQVLDALARVFGLDDAATAYLRRLATDRPARGRSRRETVPIGILQLLETLPVPAFVESRTFDILAANARITALFPGLVAGANRMRLVFLDPVERAMHSDWERTTATMVASFRTSIGTDIDDPAIVQLVGELSLASERFRKLWARHDVKALGGGVFAIDHPVAGRLDLRREKLPIAETDGQILAIYHAEPGSPSAAALERLAVSEDVARPSASARRAGAARRDR